eukprot:Phypoly_transcript_04914.p1 GENE.Phypoly_transcript_04914~~Phypoly_transcript_04914.p1  ORF type:complete len:623 (+),score=106.68 Phypoly_transcript_04914:138-2006(+)
MGDAFDFDAFYRELKSSTSSLSSSSDSIPVSTIPNSTLTYSTNPTAPIPSIDLTNPTFTTSPNAAAPFGTTFAITKPTLENITPSNSTLPNSNAFSYSTTTLANAQPFTASTITIPSNPQANFTTFSTAQSTAPQTTSTTTPTKPQPAFTALQSTTTPTKPQTTSTTSSASQPTTPPTQSHTASTTSSASQSTTPSKPQTTFTSAASNGRVTPKSSVLSHTPNGKPPAAGSSSISPPPIYTTSVKFSDLALKEEIVAGLSESGYTMCSSVQKECLPVALEGKNVVCKATPGVGKTLIFVVTILQKLQAKSEVQAIVLANTAELVSQIYNEFLKVGTYLDYLSLLSYHEYNKPDSFRLANVLVGTPAKIRTIIPKMGISSNCILALDEADRVRYKEEAVHIREIFNMLGNQKQVIIAATAMDDETDVLFKKLVPAPSHWLNLSDTTLMAESLIHTYQLVDNAEEKNKKLLAILESVEFNQMIIFVNHKPTVPKLVAFLRKHEYNVIEMSSERTFEDRLKDIAQFKKFKARLMVSTDMLSRGIDIKYVNIVLNFDMAQRSDTYLRRVGRAARFGKKGLAISFLESHADVAMRKDVENRFNVKFKTLSLQIEPKTYMNKVNEAEL